MVRLPHDDVPSTRGPGRLQNPFHGLLQVIVIVKDDEIRSPQQLDADGYKCLRVVKNGATTVTTVGHVNGLDSFTRIYAEDGTEMSVELAVLSCERNRDVFSVTGDFGAIVVERGGRIVGMIISGGGAIVGTDIIYITPQWCLDEQIKVFPGSRLYDTV